MAVQLPLQYNIDTDDDLQARLCDKGLRVVEIYSEWVGPCRSVLPTFKKIRVDKDDESALTFLTVPAEKCEYLESAKQHRGKSEPLFLLYRNGNLKSSVKGANIPVLMTQIQELTPANADLDDLSENPLYLAWQDKLNPSAKGGDLKAKKKK